MSSQIYFKFSKKRVELILCLILSIKLQTRSMFIPNHCDDEPEGLMMGKRFFNQTTLMDPIILHDRFCCSGRVSEARSPQRALIKYVSSGHSSWNWQGPAWWQEIQHGGDLMQIPQSRSVWGRRAAAGRDRRGVMKRSRGMKATAENICTSVSVSSAFMWKTN